jgi:hypothetical protein
MFDELEVVNTVQRLHMQCGSNSWAVRQKWRDPLTV